MRVSTKRILSILVGLAFLMGAFFVYLGLIRGEMTEAERVRGLLASKEALFANQERAVNQVKDLLNEFKNFARLEETVSRAVPNGASTISALRQLEAVGRTAGAVITKLDFSTPTPSSRGAPGATSVVKRLRTLEVKVRAEGPYENLKQFTKLLETSVRVANVTRLNYAPGGIASSGDSLSLEVDMYYQE
ncbi:MAG: hypothetical protein V1885_00740 [Candidatus Brennerbacteria bacterium]